MSADDFKNKGNDALAKKDFQTAVQCYTQGIALDPNNQVLYSNRSAAHLALSQFQDALNDANKAVSLKPDWGRGHQRVGQALYGLKDYEGASAALQKALSLEPNNAQIKATLEEVESAKRQQQAAAGNPFGQLFSGPQFVNKLATDPSFRALVNDPEVQQKIQMMQTNPAMANAVLQDPKMMQVLGALLGVNMSNAGAEEEKPAQASTSSTAAPPKQPEPQAAPKSQQPEQTEEIKIEEEVDNAEAEKEKNLGNEAYKKKQFDVAMKHYERAIELDPENVIYRLNKGAVLLETGKLDDCIQCCNEAIEIGRKQYADFKTIAKAYVRIANAYVKKEDYENAVKNYKEALTEHRTKDVEQLLYKAEAARRQKEEKAYINPEIAEQEKEKGNEAFKKADFPAAVKFYREAIKRNPANHIYYSNLGNAYMKLAEFHYAMTNFDKAIELDSKNQPDGVSKYVKAYKGKAQAHYFMKEYHKALEAYDQAMKIAPEDKELIDGKAKVLMAIQTTGHDEERVKRAQQDPEIQAILIDPVMQQVLRDLQQDPAAAQRHLSHPDIKKKIEKLIAAGVLGTK